MLSNKGINISPSYPVESTCGIGRYWHGKQLALPLYSYCNRQQVHFYSLLLVLVLASSDVPHRKHETHGDTNQMIQRRDPLLAHKMTQQEQAGEELLVGQGEEWRWHGTRVQQDIRHEKEWRSWQRDRSSWHERHYYFCSPRGSLLSTLDKGYQHPTQTPSYNLLYLSMTFVVFQEFVPTAEKQ